MWCLSCVGEAGFAPCTPDLECLAEFMCVANRCVPCDADVCPVRVVTAVGAEGGLACGVDKTCVTFPPGALSTAVDIEVARTLDAPTNLAEEPLSKVFAVRPASLVPALPLEVEMLVTRSVDPAQRVRLWTALEPRGPWTPLVTTRDGLRASAPVSMLGFFVLSRDERTPEELDGGVAPHPDAMPVPPMNPVDGMGAPQIMPGGALRALHGLAWDETTRRMFLCDVDTSVVYAVPHTRALPDPPVAVRRQSNRTFGLTTDGLGRLYMAEHATRLVTVLTASSAARPLALGYDGRRFNGPTDLAVRATGALYFTDPGLALAGGAPRELPYNGVFRRAPGGAITLEWQGPVSSDLRALELSHDERVLYGTDTSSRAVVAWDVAANGALSNYRRFATTRGAGLDGIAVDRLGNVYVGTAEGVEVFAPSGERWGRVETRTPVGGMAFGGPRLEWLYAASGTQVLLIPVTISGAR